MITRGHTSLFKTLLVAIFTMFVTVHTYARERHTEQQKTTIALMEDDNDVKSHSRTLYLKATYQQAQGAYSKAFKTYQTLLSQPHSNHAYEGFLNLLFDAGQFQTIVQLDTKNKKEFETTFKDNLAVKLIIAQAFLYLGEDEKAEKLFTELTEKYPDNEQVAYYSTVSYIKNNQFEKALAFLNQCLQKSSLKGKHFLFYFLKSKVYVQLHQYANALQAIEQSLKIFPKFDRGLLFKGILLEQMGKINEAISGYKNFLDLTGRDLMVEKQLVQLLFSQQRFTEAASYLKRIKSDTPEYYFDLALIELRAGHYAQALKNVTISLTKAPHFIKAKLLNVDILLALEKHTEVLDLLKQWIINEPNNNTVLHTFLLLKKSNIAVPELIATLESVITTQLENIGTLSALADLYLEAKNYEKGASCYQKILPLIDDNALKSKVLFQIGYSYFMLKKGKQAEETLKQAMEQEPVYPAVYNLLAFHYASSNKKLPYALELIEKALETDPKRPDFLDTKGTILSKLGKKTESITVLEEAKKLAPQDNIIIQHLQEAQAQHDNDKDED